MILAAKNPEEIQFTISSARAYRDVTQEELADELQVTKRSVADWESGKVKIKKIHLYAIAYVLDLSADLIVPSKKFTK
jgi:transcriptional regulator with XRE-family HTH domain